MNTSVGPSAHQSHAPLSIPHATYAMLGLDLIPKGKDEDGPERPLAWWRFLSQRALVHFSYGPSAEHDK